MKDIRGYEGLYAVTEDGRVWSYRRNKFRKLQPNKNRNGYIEVSLFKDRKEKRFKIHRLVALTYIKNPKNLPEINHINSDVTDNTIENLEWCTRRQNCDHMVKMGHSLRGEKATGNILSEKDVTEIRKLKGKFTHEEIGIQFKIARSTVSGIMSGLRWSWLD